MLGKLLEREVTSADLDGTAAITSVTVSKNVGIKPLKREIDRNCRAVVHKMSPLVLIRIACKTRQDEIEPQKILAPDFADTVIFKI